MPVKYANPGRVEFSGEIRRLENGGTFVEFPRDVEKLYGVRGRVPVRVTFDGIPYRGSMVKMGGPSHILLILKEIRERLGKDRGDEVRVAVELDEAPRVVELAEDITAALRSAGLLDRFRSMSYSHQREYALWIEDAKRPETRRRRIAQAAERLRSGKG